MNDTNHQHPLDMVHPAQRPAEPDHPFMLDGGVVDGDTEFMLRCMAEELLFMGMPIAHVQGMSKDAQYQGLYAARHALGDARTDAILEEVGERIGRHRHRTIESSSQSHSATLTVSAGGETTSRQEG